MCSVQYLPSAGLPNNLSWVVFNPAFIRVFWLFCVLHSACYRCSIQLPNRTSIRPSLYTLKIMYDRYNTIRTQLKNKSQLYENKSNFSWKADCIGPVVESSFCCELTVPVCNLFFFCQTLAAVIWSVPSFINPLVVIRIWAGLQTPLSNQCKGQRCFGAPLGCQWVVVIDTIIFDHLWGICGSVREMPLSLYDPPHLPTAHRFSCGSRRKGTSDLLCTQRVRLKHWNKSLTPQLNVVSVKKVNFHIAQRIRPFGNPSHYL